MKNRSSPLQIILIGNYRPDKQESMIRFYNMLENGITKQNISCKIWLPPVVFAIFLKDSKRGFSKWIGYIDKYLLAPIYFFVKSHREIIRNKNVVFHICDHSNSIYLNFLPTNRVLITCHDVIAIRGAFGHKDCHCEATWLGKILQKRILKNLIKAPLLAAVSENTKNQFLDICKSSQKNNEIVVVKNGLNQPFKQLNEIEKDQLEFIIPDKPFLLHVGSNLPRKNRKILLEIMAQMGDRFNGYLCLAGKGPDSNLKKEIVEFNLSDKILVFENINHQSLNLLYNTCFAFIFPSFSEGFGWPIIEAQMCGAPVVCSNIEPFKEITNNSALMADPYDAQQFVEQIQKLYETDFRKETIRKGKINANNFTSEKMILNYYKLYKKIASE